MIDTHCHVYEEEMSNYDDIIVECSSQGISMIVNSVDIPSSKEVIKLSKKYKNVYAAIGLNYDTIDRVEEKDLIELEKLIQEEKIVAIGEIGLDYYLDIYLNGFKNFIMNFVKEFYPTLNDFIIYWSDLSIFVN